jgi:hypothetical protein
MAATRPVLVPLFDFFVAAGFGESDWQFAIY